MGSLIKMKKGSIANVIPILGLLLASVLFTFQSIPISNAFSSELTESISDLNRVTQTKSVADLYLYNQIPMAASHSVHQASYTVASQGGSMGLNYVEWTYDGVRESGLYGTIRNTISNNLRTITVTTFQDKYLGDTKGFGDCEINRDDFSLLMPGYQQSGDTDDIAGSVNPGGRLEVSCESSDGSTRYLSEYLSANFEANDNRFYQLSDDTVSFFEDLGESWQEVGSVRRTGTTCGSVSESQYRSKENSAASAVQSQISSRFSSVLENYPTYEGFKIAVARTIDFTNSMTYDTYSEANYKGYSQSGSNVIGCCGPSCTKTRYRYWVEVFPEESRVDWSLKDAKHKVPIEDGWKSLHFNVSTYSQTY
jgi:hypothetical protein